MDLLTTERLEKDFSGIHALSEVSMAIKKGTIHSLIGPNGSGKTTFFNVVTGLLPVTEGIIRFDDTGITDLSPHLRTKMGISRTFQIPQVIPDMTCQENVMLGFHCHTKTDIGGTLFRLPFTSSSQENWIKQRALKLLEFIGLKRSAAQPARDLSWVDEQLLQLARALAVEPQLLLLDEPTAGMGTAEIEKIKKVIMQIRDTGITVMLVAHDINLVMGISDWITVLNFGYVIAEGTAEQVQNEPSVLEAYLGKK
jgi:branched-chain amino acid transport system ATP-binding protein